MFDRCGFRDTLCPRSGSKASPFVGDKYAPRSRQAVNKLYLSTHIPNPPTPPPPRKSNVRCPSFMTSTRCTSLTASLHTMVPAGSPLCGGNVTVYVYDINQPSLPIAFYLVLVSVSVFMALSTVFYSINTPDNSLFSHSVLSSLSLPY